MRKKLIVIVLAMILIVLPGCFIKLQIPQTPAPSATGKTHTPTPTKTPKPTPLPIPSFSGLQPSAYTAEDYSKFFNMDREGLFQVLGGKFVLTDLRPGFNKPYTYYGEYENKDLGVHIGFIGTDQAIPLYMHFDAGKGMKGLAETVDFRGIQSLLGKGETGTTWREKPDNVLYDLTYEHEGFSLEFLSEKADGTGWRLECWKGYAKGTPVQNKPFVSSYPALKEDSILQKNGWTLGEIASVMGMKKYELEKRLGYEHYAAGYGANEYFFTLLYDEMGLRFNFDPEPLDSKGIPLADDEMDFDTDANNTLQMIYITKGITLKGIIQNMNYKEVQKKLGKGELSSGQRSVYTAMYSSDKTANYYELHYDLGSFTMVFYSTQKDGTYWQLLIY